MRKNSCLCAGSPSEKCRSLPGDVILRGGISEKEYKEIIPETDDALAEKMESMFRRLKEYIRFPVTDSCFCVSAGSASVPDDETDYDRLFQIADEALYAAKRAGKNRWSAGTKKNAV